MCLSATSLNVGSSFASRIVRYWYRVRGFNVRFVSQRSACSPQVIGGFVAGGVQLSPLISRRRSVSQPSASSAVSNVTPALCRRVSAPR